MYLCFPSNYQPKFEKAAHKVEVSGEFATGVDDPVNIRVSSIGVVSKTLSRMTTPTSCPIHCVGDDIGGVRSRCHRNAEPPPERTIALAFGPMRV